MHMVRLLIAYIPTTPVFEHLSFRFWPRPPLSRSHINLQERIIRHILNQQSTHNSISFQTDDLPKKNQPTHPHYPLPQKKRILFRPLSTNIFRKLRWTCLYHIDWAVRCILILELRTQALNLNSCFIFYYLSLSFSLLFYGFARLWESVRVLSWISIHDGIWYINRQQGSMFILHLNVFNILIIFN